MACLMVLGLTQCKKNEPTNNNTADNGNRVNITLTLDNGGQRVHPEEENGVANVVYDNGDVVYVGSDGKYMGYLTYNGSMFTGSINAEAIQGAPLQFIFMGGQTIDGLTENSSTECVFNIGNQSNGLAVISCAPSNEDFSPTEQNYTAYLRNKCALVKFDLGEVSTDAAITIAGLKTEATIGFGGTVTNGTATGDIVPYGIGSTRYAVVLSDQAAVTNGTISCSGCTGTFSIPTAAYTNAFLTDATITLNPPTVATPPPPHYTEPEFMIGQAYCYGALESLTGIEEYGICWSTEFFNPNETQVNYAVGNDWNDGVFSAPFRVTFGTTYYYCAYAKNVGGYGYGEVKNFTPSFNPTSRPTSRMATCCLSVGCFVGDHSDEWYVANEGHVYIEDYGDYDYAPAHEGNYSLYINHNCYYGSDYFVSAQLPFDGSAASISFAYVTPEFLGSMNTLSVAYTTDPIGGAWQTTSFEEESSEEWTEVTVDLSDVYGDCYIAFVCTDNCGLGTAIDNIVITIGDTKMTPKMGTYAPRSSKSAIRKR